MFSCSPEFRFNTINVSAGDNFAQKPSTQHKVMSPLTCAWMYWKYRWFPVSSADLIRTIFSSYMRSWGMSIQGNTFLLMLLLDFWFLAFLLQEKSNPYQWEDFFSDTQLRLGSHCLKRAWGWVLQSKWSLTWEIITFKQWDLGKYHGKQTREILKNPVRLRDIRCIQRNLYFCWLSLLAVDLVSVHS